MPRLPDRELESILSDEIDEEDALLRHVFGDDERPPQGLHQQGWRQSEEEQEWYSDWMYPRSLEAEDA